MKINIRNIKMLMAASLLVIGSGCSDFLEDKDPSSLSPDKFFTLPEHAEPAVNAVYENLRFFSGGAGIFSSNFQLLDALSGIARTETAQNSDLNNLYGFSYTGDNLHLSQWWRELYEGVANANLAIDGITSFTTAPLRISSFIGILVSFVAFVYILYLLVRPLFRGFVVL